MAKLARLLSAFVILPMAAHAQSACDWKGQVSPGTSQAVTFSVENKTDNASSLYWIDFDGRPIFYADVPPNGRHEQGTYQGHLWVLENRLGECNRVFAAQQDGIIRITPADDREEGVGKQSDAETN